MNKDIKSRSGFHFMQSIGKENESHQDCACSLASSIGHDTKSMTNYEYQCSFWNMVPNIAL